MRVKFWGVRGSLPSPMSPEAIEARVRELLGAFLDLGFKSKTDIPKFLERLAPHRLGGYGGNSTCVEVATDRSRLILDGGSGIRSLGYELLKGPCGQGSGEAHILMTHFHWDHLIGLPFFTPLFIPGNRIHLYAVQPELPEILGTVFRKPCFPVELRDLAAKLEYHAVKPRAPFAIGDLEVTAYRLDHPDPCWGYKIRGGDKTIAHCVDTECLRVSRHDLGEDLPLYQGLDLLIFDAQYTLMEAVEKMNWGHAAASLGLDIAMREGAKQVLFMHHDPASSDEKISQAEAQARHYYSTLLKNARRGGTPLQEVAWAFAREGQVVDL